MEPLPWVERYILVWTLGYEYAKAEDADRMADQPPYQRPTPTPREERIQQRLAAMETAARERHERLGSKEWDDVSTAQPGNASTTTSTTSFE